MGTVWSTWTPWDCHSFRCLPIELRWRHHRFTCWKVMMASCSLKCMKYIYVLLDDTMIYMKKIFQHIYKHMISIWIEKNQIILTLELLCSCKLTYGCQRRCMRYAWVTIPPGMQQVQAGPLQRTLFKSDNYSWWFQPLWKIWVKFGNLHQIGDVFPFVGHQIGVNIKHIWNHHLG